jgi:hypothetical protein
MKISLKRINYFTLLIITGLILSCSSDDPTNDCTATLWYEDADEDGFGNPNIFITSCEQPEGYVDNNTDDDDTNNSTETNYFTLAIDNTWTYDVTTDDNTTPPTNSTDEITVDETTTINTKDYYGMSSSTGSTGTMTQLFDQNYFRVENNVTYIQGDFVLPLSNFGGTDITIALDDAKLIDTSKTSGTILTSITDVASQDIGGFILDINYTLKTIQREALTSHTVGVVSYNDIIKSDIILTIKVTTDVEVIPGFPPVTVTLLDTQNLLTLNNFYANGIGLIDSDSVFTYTLEDLSAFPVTIPFPETATINTAQEITSYNVAN